MTLLTGKSALAGNFIGGRGGLGGFFGRHGAVFDIPGIRVNSTLVVVFKQGDIWQVNSTESEELSCVGGGCLKVSRNQISARAAFDGGSPRVVIYAVFLVLSVLSKKQNKF